MVSARDTTFRCGSSAAGQGGGGECVCLDNYELLLILLNECVARGGGAGEAWQANNAQTRQKINRCIQAGAIYIHKLQSINSEGEVGGRRRGEEELHQRDSLILRQRSQWSLAALLIVNCER